MNVQLFELSTNICMKHFIMVSKSYSVLKDLSNIPIFAIHQKLVDVFVYVIEYETANILNWSLLLKVLLWTFILSLTVVDVWFQSVLQYTVDLNLKFLVLLLVRSSCSHYKQPLNRSPEFSSFFRKICFMVADILHNTELLFWICLYSCSTSMYISTSVNYSY